MKPHPYLILVEGDLRDGDRPWLGNLEIRPSGVNRTVLTGELDQSGLHGVLRRLQHLSIDIVEVRRTPGCARSSTHEQRHQRAS